MEMIIFGFFPCFSESLQNGFVVPRCYPNAKPMPLINSNNEYYMLVTCAKLAEWPRGCLQSSSTPVQIGNLALGDSAAIAERFHPDPFRTRQLSSLTSDIVMRYASSRELFNAAPPFFLFVLQCFICV